MSIERVRFFCRLEKCSNNALISNSVINETSSREILDILKTTCGKAMQSEVFKWYIQIESHER